MDIQASILTLKEINTKSKKVKNRDDNYSNIIKHGYDDKPRYRIAAQD